MESLLLQMVSLLNPSMIHNSLPVVVMGAEVTAGVLAGTGSKLELFKLELTKLELIKLKSPVATNGFSFKQKCDTQFPPTSSGHGG